MSISEKEYKEAELQESITELQQQLDNYVDSVNLTSEVKQEEIIFTNDVFIPPSNKVIDYPPNENEMHPQTEPTTRRLIFDTRDLFRYQRE